MKVSKLTPSSAVRRKKSHVLCKDKLTQSDESEDLRVCRADQLYARTLMRNIIRSWKLLCQSLNPSPVKNSIAVFALFKWISMSFDESDTKDSCSKLRELVSHLSFENFNVIPRSASLNLTIGAPKFFSTRIRHYVANRIEVSVQRLPLFVHATALLDVFTMKETFLFWKETHIRVRSIVLLCQSRLTLRCFNRWLLCALRKNRLKRLFSAFKARYRFRLQKSVLSRWLSTFKVFNYLESTVIPRIFGESLRFWFARHSKNKALSHSLITSVDFYQRNLLLHAYQKWILRLIPLRSPFFILNSYQFHQYLLCFFIVRWKSSLARISRLKEELSHRSKYFYFHPILQRFINQNHPEDICIKSSRTEGNSGLINTPHQSHDQYSHEYVAKSFSVFSEQEHRNGYDKIQQIIRTIHSNLSSSQSQKFLLELSEKYFRLKTIFTAVKQWQIRIPQLCLDSRINSVVSLPWKLYPGNLSSNLFNEDVNHRFHHHSSQQSHLNHFRELHRRVHTVFHLWKKTSSKKGFLRSCYFSLKTREDNRIRSRYFGLWIIVTVKYQEFEKNTNRIVNKRILKELFFGFFAWRNQYERAVLVRNNQKTLLLLRNQEIQEYSNYANEKRSYQSKSVIMRQWALYVRDRSKGKRLYSIWFRYSGKAMVVRYFYRWKMLFSFVYYQCVKIQKSWKGYVCRFILFPKRYQYLCYFRRRSSIMVRFQRVSRQKRFFLLLLKNLLFEKKKHLEEMKRYWKKRLIRSLFCKWQKVRKQKTKIQSFSSFILRKVKSRSLFLRWFDYSNRKKFLMIFQKYLRRTKVLPLIRFWKNSFTFYRKLFREKGIICYNQQLKRRYLKRKWLVWRSEITTRKEERKNVSLFVMGRKFQRWRLHLNSLSLVKTFREKWLRNRMKSLFVRWIDRYSNFHRLYDQSQFHHCFALKRRFFSRFINHLRKVISYKQSRQPFLLQKYGGGGGNDVNACHSSNRRNFNTKMKSKKKGNNQNELNRYQRKMINFLNKKYLFHNIRISKCFQRLRDNSWKEKKRNHLIYEKLLLFEKRKLLKYFKRFYFPIKKKFSSKKYPSSSVSSSSSLLSTVIPSPSANVLSDYYYNSLQYSSLLSKYNANTNKQLRKIRFQKAVKCRLYLYGSSSSSSATSSSSSSLIADVVLRRPLINYHYFHKWLLLTNQRLRRRRILSQLFHQFVLKKFEEFLLKKLLPTTKRNRKIRRLLKICRAEKEREKEREFFNTIRLRIKRKRRRFHLLKVYLLKYQMKVKINVYFQKLKKFTYLKRKLVFEVVSNRRPSSLPLASSSPVAAGGEREEEEERDRMEKLSPLNNLDKSHIQFPDYHCEPSSSYQIKQIKELSSKFDPSSDFLVERNDPFFQRREEGGRGGGVIEERGENGLKTESSLVRRNSTLFFTDFGRRDEEGRGNETKGNPVKSFRRSSSSSSGDILQRKNSQTYSLFYFQQEMKSLSSKSTLKVIDKLQKKCKHFLEQLKLNVFYRKQFLKTKSKPLKERMKSYLLIQFHKLEAFLQKSSLQRQINELIGKKFHKKRMKSAVRYWTKVTLLRKKFHLIRKRFFLFPLFQKWLVLTISLLKYRRVIVKMTAKRELSLKRAILSSWFSYSKKGSQISSSFRLVSSLRQWKEKQRLFFHWIYRVDSERLQFNFERIQKRRLFFLARTAFRCWEKAMFYNEVITWKNGRIGFKNWKAILQSRSFQRKYINQAALSYYFKKVRSFMFKLLEIKKKKHYFEEKVRKMVKKNRLNKILRSFRNWKRKMYWKSRNQLKLYNSRYDDSLRSDPIRSRFKRENETLFQRSSDNRYNCRQLSSIKSFPFRKNLSAYHLFSAFLQWFRYVLSFFLSFFLSFSFLTLFLYYS
jgi:hypothetical protein